MRKYCEKIHDYSRVNRKKEGDWLKNNSELVDFYLTPEQQNYFKAGYANKNVAVTGGASFIGSNLVDLLLKF